MKERGQRWAMLTAYDMYTAEIFDEAGIPVLLVGDSAGNNVYGFETTVPVTVDHLVPLCRAVTSAAKHAMVVADLPFGSYQASPQQALATATRFMKEGMAHAVKLEGGAADGPGGRAAGARRHPGHGPHRLHPAERARTRWLQGPGTRLGRRQAHGGRPRPRVRRLLRHRHGDGPRPVAAKVTEALRIPTIGIGAGRTATPRSSCGRTWRGLRGGRAPRFVKKYADLRADLKDAAGTYAAEVASGVFPATEHSFES